MSRAVKFGVPGETGPVLGSCYCRVGPVVVTATSDALDLFNGLTGELALWRNRNEIASQCLVLVLLFVSHTPNSPGISFFPAADRKRRLKRTVPITCVDFKADTTFGFIMLAGTAHGEVVLYDVSSLK